MNARVELHLRVRVREGMRREFLQFLREAAPFYESPGGIRVSLLREASDPNRFIELVAYASEADYQRDQIRADTDPEMLRHLDRWRSLLAEPPVVEVYRPAQFRGEGSDG
jgi:quinol monooxygenase YgiN